jgi:phospholipid/cholesterol/gamma-HCH transport system ATP-binding protein
VIEVSHVSTRFGEAVVHEDVSFTIHRGEVFAIAGGNGCGKSTLMREIVGLQRYRLDSAFEWMSVVARRATAKSIAGSAMFQQGACSVPSRWQKCRGAAEGAHGWADLIHDIVAPKLSRSDCGPTVLENPNELSGGMREAGWTAAIVMDPSHCFG